MANYVCEHPSHHGDRRVPHPGDRYQARIEFRRSDAQTRPHARNFFNVCKVCMEEFLWPAVERSSDNQLANLFMNIESLAPPSAGNQQGLL